MASRLAALPLVSSWFSVVVSPPPLPEGRPLGFPPEDLGLPQWGLGLEGALLGSPAWIPCLDPLLGSPAWISCLDRGDPGSTGHPAEPAAREEGGMGLLGFFRASGSSAPVGTECGRDAPAWLAGTLAAPGVKGRRLPRSREL